MSDVEDFLAKYPPEIQAITRRLRELVGTRGTEVLYAKENHFGYSFTGKSNDRILYVCPIPKYVRLGFMRGTQLPDPQNLLIGEGKWLRHIKVRTLEQADDPAVQALIEAAWTYGLEGSK
jgi:hypothetical protein